MKAINPNTFAMYGFTVLAATVFSAVVVASESSGERTINGIGCHRHDQICFIEISGEPVGPSACRTNSVRWSRNEANGEAAFTHFTAAHIANKKVILHISDGCFPNQPSFPSFDYWYIK